VLSHLFPISRRAPEWGQSLTGTREWPAPFSIFRLYIVYTYIAHKTYII
jgi:hypothetical protein